MRLILQELIPHPRELDVSEVYTDLELAANASGERPYVVLNMVSTVDGKASIDGRSGSIGNEADRAIFANLRTQVDAVMVGAGTVRSERYGRLVRSPERRAIRTDQGLEPDPLAVVMSGSGEIPSDTPLLQDGSSQVVVFTNARPNLSEAAASVAIEHRGGERIDLGEALVTLQRGYEVSTVLLEGGPRLAGEMLAGRLVDELFLTLAPSVASGEDAPTIFGASSPALRELELLSVFHWRSSLFLRYRLARWKAK